MRHKDRFSESLTAEQANAENRVFVAFGANLPGPFGSPEASLRYAMDRLFDAGAETIHGGAIYCCPAFPPGSGPDFVNSVVSVTVREADPFIESLFEIESEFNRAAERAAGRWKPRSIDVDIISVGQEIRPSLEEHNRIRARPQIDRTTGTEGVILPHPSMHERAFVLVPLADFAPDWRHPILGKTAAALVAELPNEDRAAVVPTK